MIFPLPVNCNEDLAVNSGLLEMPNDPPGYTGPQECTWKITVPTGNTIAVMINTIDVRKLEDTKPNGMLKLHCSRSELEQIAFDSSCDNNHLKFYDGPDDTSSEIGTFCGQTPPDHFMTSSNQMFVTIKTDGALARPSFNVAYEMGKRAIHACHAKMVMESQVIF